MAKNNKEQLPDVPETMEDYMLQQLKKTVILKDGSTLRVQSSSPAFNFATSTSSTRNGASV